MTMDDGASRPQELTLPAKVRVLRYFELLRFWPAFGAVLLLSFATRGRLAGGLFFVLMLASVLVAALKAWFRRSHIVAQVRTRPGGAVIESSGKRLEIRRDDVTRAHADREGDGSRVVVEAGPFTRYELSFEDPGGGRALLRAMRLSALDTPLTFSFFFNLRVTIGADGVLVAWPLLRRRRFIPHGDIEAVDAPDAENVVLRLKGGKTYSISTRTSPGQPKSEQSALIERLTDAWEAYRAGVAPDALGLLARAGRGTLDWVRGLRALGEGQGSGYRGIGLTPEHLWRIAEDPSAPRESRVGAALALRPTLDDEGRGRLRVAAESSASPKVRVALEATADEVDDEAVAARIEGQARVT
jgi:hypothetical protein